MARFLFHLHDCGQFTPASEARGFESLDAAVEQAKREARDLLAAEVRDGRLSLGCQVEVVEEETGRTVIVPFSSIVQLEATAYEAQPFSAG